MSRPHLLDALRDRVLLADGGTGSRVQAMALEVERDYWGRENCTDVLVLSLSLTTVSPVVLAVSVVGVVVLNLIVALNHRAGRYLA